MELYIEDVEDVRTVLPFKVSNADIVDQRIDLRKRQIG
jgi:hypothetical protein